MNKIIESDFNNIYYKILKFVYDNGKFEGKTLNCYDLDFILTNPNNCTINIKKNWIWAFAELFDRIDPQFKNPGLSYHFRSNWSNKLKKEGGKFCYSYNERIGHQALQYSQLQSVITKLVLNKLEREAIISIWNPKDVFLTRPRRRKPCTLTLHFLIENQKLSLFVNMRSSDIINLLPYDVIHHTFLQRYAAVELEIEPGNFYFRASHFYSPKKRQLRGYLEKTINTYNFNENDKLKDFTIPLNKYVKKDLISHYKMVYNSKEFKPEIIGSMSNPAIRFASRVVIEGLLEKGVI